MYESSIRAHIDEQAHRGKPLIIDIEIGDYEMGEDSMEVTDRLLAKHPGAALYGMRVGFPTFAKIGGGWGFNKP